MITLTEQESSHCVRVLRMKTGDEISVTDGKGHLFAGVIELAHDKKTSIKVLATTATPPSQYELHLYVALTKHADRLEWMLEKAVEFGITSFTPLITQRTERKTIRIDRLESTVLSAMKQSLKTWLPRVNPPTKFSEVISSGLTGTMLVAHCNNGPRELLSDLPAAAITHAFIGPEGDFSNEEVEMAAKKGAKSISLGNSRLRTETAGLLICSSLYISNMKG